MSTQKYVTEFMFSTLLQSVVANNCYK